MNMTTRTEIKGIFKSDIHTTVMCLMGAPSVGVLLVLPFDKKSAQPAF